MFGVDSKYSYSICSDLVDFYGVVPKPQMAGRTFQYVLLTRASHFAAAGGEGVGDGMAIAADANVSSGHFATEKFMQRCEAARALVAARRAMTSLELRLALLEWSNQNVEGAPVGLDRKTVARILKRLEDEGSARLVVVRGPDGRSQQVRNSF
jgi:hypothetical protein